MAKNEKEREQWLSLAQAAMSKYEPPNKKLTDEEFIDDLTEFVGGVADSLLDAADERYTGGQKKASRRGRRRDDDDDDPPESE